MNTGKCRLCGAELSITFVDLGMSPPSNAFLLETSLPQMERFYPLHTFVCSQCFLVQLEEFETPQEIFSDYVYFSSYSTSWLEHCKNYARAAKSSLNLSSDSLVVELASNDGYLLQYFLEENVKVLGIEPAANVAAVAREKGIPTEIAFFGESQAMAMMDRLVSADLIVANNVLAHVPDIHDFVRGISLLLAQSGTVTFEFPHLLKLIKYNQYDTIYHEHFSYLSLTTVSKLLEKHSLRAYRIEQLPTHGGSLRVWACHGDARIKQDSSVDEVLADERTAGLQKIDGYLKFAELVGKNKRDLLKVLIEAKEAGKRIVAYGAAAKGTTLLNYCGIRADFVDYVCDRNPHKQGRYMPGCRIPVLDPKAIFEERPDYVLILPWNLRSEIAEQLNGIREWGGRFIVPIPAVEIF
uniref:C-methyltransferase n=1 Tax=mine drainage metagenome TaxID=410659 RepID=E6Q721_9ZZZZ